MKKKEKTVRVLMVILVLLLGEIALAVDWDPNTPFIKVQLSWAQIQNIVFDEEDNIYISGTYHGPTAIENHTTGKVFVAKFDPSGREQWMNRIGEGDNNQRDLPHLAYFDGIVYFLWRENSYETGGSQIYLSKLDRNSGNEVLKQVISNNPFTEAMVVDSNGIYIASEHPNPSRLGSILTKFNRDGTKVWELDLSGWRLGGPFITDIVLDNNGDIYLGGDFARWGSTSLLYDAFVGKYSKDKQKIWSKKWATSTDDEIFSIALSSNGLYALGTTGSPRHGLLIKYDFNGNLLWDSEGFPELKELLSESGFFSNIAIDNSGVYLGSYYKLAKLDTGKLDSKEGQGLVLWRIDRIGNSGFAGMAINKNNLLIADKNQYWGTIYCFNTTTGQQTAYMPTPTPTPTPTPQPRSAVKDWIFYE